MPKEPRKPAYSTITITEQDIEKAERNNSYKCVVAQSIARQIPLSHKIEVDVQTIRYTDREGNRKAFLTPYAVQGYITAFDAGEKPEPFSFQLRRPMHVRRRFMTEPGRKRHNEAVKARRRAKTEGRSDVDARTAAREARVAAKRANPGRTQTTSASSSSESPAVKSPPRVFKLKKRTYGMRMLRVNQERKTAESVAR